MARWRHAFVYEGPRDRAEFFGRVFPRGETVVVALDHWNSGVQRQAERAGLKYLGLVDCLAPAPVSEPGPGTEASASVPAPAETRTTIRITKGKGRPRGSY